MKFIFCFKSTSNISNTDQSNPESGSTTEEQPIFTLYGSGEAYDGDYFESDFASIEPGLAAKKRDETYLLCYPGMYTNNGWDLMELIGGQMNNPVFGTTRISPQPTGPDTSETYWDRTYAGNSDKKPQVKIMDGIEFVVICPSSGRFSNILPLLRGFYTWDGTGNYWKNQRGTARIIQKDDKFYFNTNLSDINDFVLESVGSPSSPVCQYQTIDGTIVESGAMQVKFAYEVFGG